MPTISAASRLARTRLSRAVLLAVAALLTPSLLAPTATAVSPVRDKPEATPPPRMSTIGGVRLGEPGTQVDPLPGKDAPKLPEKLTARSWIVADAESGNVLAAHNAHWELAPASTLKMLFADVVLPKFPKDRKYTVKKSDLAGVGAGSSRVGIKPGLTYTVEDLWNGVFLRSGNDAVHVLAAMNGGVEKTVREMNARAKELRALDTHVVSPDGYDKPGQVSSAYDLTLIARSGMQKKDFRQYVSTVRTKFPGGWTTGEDGEKKREHKVIQNTNRLLTGDVGLEPYPGLAGVKNGYTTNAGNTFTGVAERNGRVLLVTVMHPEDGHLTVYKKAANLLDWGFSAAGKVRPVGELVPPADSDAGGGPAGGPGEPQTDGGSGGGANNGAGGGDAEGGEDSLASAGNGAGGAAQASGGGAGVALGITAGALVVIAGVAYGVHRRWPMALPEVSRLWRRPRHEEEE